MEIWEIIMQHRFRHMKFYPLYLAILAIVYFLDTRTMLLIVDAAAISTHNHYGIAARKR